MLLFGFNFNFNTVCSSVINSNFQTKNVFEGLFQVFHLLMETEGIEPGKHDSTSQV